MPSSLSATLMALLLAASGCLAAMPELATPPTAANTAWPHPTGNEWPLDLQGPFELDRIIDLPLLRPDGVRLMGSVLLPKVSAHVRVPTIVEVGPYFDGEDQPTGSTQKVSVQEPSRPLDWIRHGYAVAYYSVRGTGKSTGCFEMGGLNEQKDTAAVVEMLASQPWSNGRVGMMGLSYPGTTPIEAAIHNPKGLAAIAVMGTIVDMQFFWQSPQHAPSTFGGFFGAVYGGRVSMRPAADAELPQRHLQRVCPEVVAVMQGGMPLWYNDQHDTRFWLERRYRTQVPNMSAAVFLQQGFDDAYNSGHMMQDRYLWSLYEGPKRMFEGQWGHSTPPPANIRRADPNATYTSLTMQWFDYWLKGIGTPEQAKVGVAEFEDNRGTWHRSSDFPPAEAQEWRLHLGDGKSLTAEAPAQGVAGFRAVPGHGPDTPPCTAPIRGGIAYTTAPFEEDTTIAGFPDLHLTLESNRPSGSIHAMLFHVRDDPGDGCMRGQWQDFSWGDANIRFWHGGGTGRDFPVGQPTTLRIEMADFAETFQKGERLGLAISGFETFHVPPQDYPDYRIHEGQGTHLTLQVLPTAT